MFWVLKDEQEVRQVNQLGRDNSICKASACGRPWVCVCVCVCVWMGCKKVKRVAKMDGGRV